MEYIVTGATGHIGNVVVGTLLKNGESVTALSLKNEDLTPLNGLDVKIVIGDVTDRNFVFKFIKPNCVVLHLAGIIDIGIIPYNLIYNVNVLGTKNIVDACIQNGAKKLIYLSTVHIIDPQKHGDILVETSTFNKNKIIGDYAKTKLEATEYIFDACKNKGLNATVLYPSGVIGPYDFKISEVGQVVLDHMNGKLLAYVKGGYNFVDVRDVATATVSAVKNGRCCEGYIVGGRPVTLLELLKTINKKLGKKHLPPKIAMWFVRLFAGITNTYYKLRGKKPIFSAYSLYTLNSNANFSNEKAKKELNYQPISFEKSIYDQIDWFIENKPELVKLKKKYVVLKTK
ncbi:MAG: NAD-dependent epimerase/dehydratase family protein [Clostridia bacterium]